MTNSPLGQYAPIVASVTAVGVIAAFLISAMFGAQLGISTDVVNTLKDVSLIALGAVFGSAVATNGTKAATSALHRRVDAMEAAVTPTIYPDSKVG